MLKKGQISRFLLNHVSKPLHKYEVVPRLSTVFLTRCDSRQLKHNEFCFTLIFFCWLVKVQLPPIWVLSSQSTVLNLVCISGFKVWFALKKLLLSPNVSYLSIKCLFVKVGCSLTCWVVVTPIFINVWSSFKNWQFVSFDFPEITKCLVISSIFLTDIDQWKN